MIVAIHQPSYFPWLGLLHKIYASDLFIVLNQVQLSDSAYQHRNLFLTNNGVQKFLTIPFNRDHYRDKRLQDLRIANQDWVAKHRNFLVNNYGSHPFFGEVYPRILPFFELDESLLFDTILLSMKICIQLFDIKTEIKLQSEIPIKNDLRREELVEGLVVAVGASVYLSGDGAKNYLTKGSFKNGAHIQFDKFAHPVYLQKHTKEFVAGLSCLDLLFNVGIEQSRILMQNISPENI